MKLLAELQDPLKLIVEGEGADKKHYLSGLFLEFDNKNRNGRIYRSEYHDPSVQNYLREKVREGRGWSELDHPESATINLKNACARVLEMWKEGTNWFGKSIITNTPMGQIVKGLLESGGTLGTSSRGVGSVMEVSEGVLEVQPDYKIITAGDVVSDPSAHGALLKGIMENVDYLYDEASGSYLAQESTKVKNAVHKMSKSQIEEQHVVLIENFIKALKYNK